MLNPGRLSFWQLWNMCFGFFGIQFGWALQMTNMSSIYQFLGAEADKIAILWIAAPLTGLLVQPLVGYYSDRTWCRFGRRRPYFIVGAISASIALVLMPHSSQLWMAVGLLWLLDASANLSMEPFRAFVGDLVPEEQHQAGFAMQSLFLGLGAVLSSMLPWILVEFFGVPDFVDGTHKIPRNIIYAFSIGAGVLLVSVAYTVLTTKEHPPADLDSFLVRKAETAGFRNALSEIFGGIWTLPKIMRQLAIVQFFTWFALFCLWIYFAPTVAGHVFHGIPAQGGLPADKAYKDGVTWATLLFGIYNGSCFLFSFLLMMISGKFKAKSIHRFCLICGGISLGGIAFIDNKYLLFLPMIGLGVALASIVSMPYAILVKHLPQERLGFYMGVFNFFSVIPQITASLTLGPLLSGVFDGETTNIMFLGGASLLIASFCLFWVKVEAKTV